MSDDSGKKTVAKVSERHLWGPVGAVVLTIVLYFLSQFFVGLLFGVTFKLLGWSREHVDAWVDTTSGQFLFILVSGVFTLLALGLLLKWRRFDFRKLGFRRWPQWGDGLRVIVGFSVYFVAFIAATIIASQVLGVNTQQEQEIGFEAAKGGGGGLYFVFLSLVLLPPIVEETLFRGFLFSGLRTKLSFPWATVITSILFATPHLLASSSGLLWIAGIDTFILSLVLCFMREHTGALWASIGIHMVKNSIAFLYIFVVQ